MNLKPTEYKHIGLDRNSIPYIMGSTMKVIELVSGYLAFGWSPEEIHFQHPYLTLGQIHSGLAYYWDYKEELEADMQRRFEYVEKLRREAGESPLRKKFRANQVTK
ncbi:MAG: DUF433 domain-containing protein [Spirulina sp.]